MAKERPRVTFPQLVRALSGSFPHMARSLGVGLIAFVILGIFGAIVLVLWYGARLMKEGVISHGEQIRHGNGRPINEATQPSPH